MKLDPFKLERYFAIHEFSARYLLSSSDCDGYPISYVLEQASAEEMRLYENIQLGYTESAGHPLLRESIKQYYQINSIDNIVVSSPGELNFSAMNVLLNKQDHVISISPSYQSLYQVVESIGCELSFWKPNPENWIFRVEDLEELIQENTKLIIINFPHNPTGSYLHLSELEKLIGLARKHDIYIFSDEMYHKLVMEGTEELPPMANLYEKGLSLWGTSKTFGLAGLRIGWLVSQDKEVLDKVVAYKDYLSICSGAPLEILSMIALNHIDAFLQPNLKKIYANVKHFESFASKSSLIDQFIPPRAGSTAFVKLNIDTTAQAFSDDLVGKTGIMTVPGEMFRAEGKYIRVGFGRENIPEILQKLS